MGNGSDELIHLLGLVLLDEDSEMMMGDPGFSRYDASAHLSRSKLVKVPLDADYRHDLPAMARAVTPRTRLITIANPNNPTGTIVRKPEVDRFLADIPDDVVVVLDEAYMEFAEDLPDFPNSLDYVTAGRPNVVGLRDLQQGLRPRGNPRGLRLRAPRRSRTRSTGRASLSTSIRSPRSRPSPPWTTTITSGTRWRPTGGASRASPRLSRRSARGPWRASPTSCTPTWDGPPGPSSTRS